VCRITTSRCKSYAVILAFCASFLFLPVAEAIGDYVVLKNGKRINGVIRSESAQWVTIENIEGITLTLDRTKIDHIEKQPTGENLMLSGILALRKPDFLEAASVLKRALQAGADPAQMRKRISEISPFFLDRLAYVSNTEKKEWLSLCDDLARRDSSDADWAYLRGDMAIAMGDNSAALDAWRSLDAAYFSVHSKERERVVRWALKRLSQAVLDRRLDEGVGVLELMNSLDPERARSCRAILAMQKAADARDRGNVAEACRIYAEELMPLAPEISKVCLRTIVEPQCELLCKRGAYNEAAALVRECVKPHLPELASRLLAQIHRGHITQCLADGRWELARGLLAEGSEFFDDAELERLKQECVYGEQRSRVAPDDGAGHYKMGLELQGKKMNGAAIEEFILAGRSPQLKEMADKQIALIHESEALDLTEKISSRYGERKYLEVLDLVDEFRRKFPTSDLSGKVDAISKQAHQKAGEAAKTAESLAISQLEQARRLYYQGQIARARELVDGVLGSQPTTSTVAAPARALRQEILKIQLAEGVATGHRPEVKPKPSTSATMSLVPRIDPGLLDQLNEDAYKNELQEILKQLQL
jgi:hypothetical protein